MKDWIKKLNDILTINDREILEHAGKIRKKLADEIATAEYDKYSKQRSLAEKEQSIKELEQEMNLLNNKP